MDPSQGIIDSIQHFFEPFLDTIFGIFLNLGPALALIVLSLIIALIGILVHKKFTNQEELKNSKEEVTEIKKQLKEVSKTDPQKAMDLNKKLMEKTAVQFRSTWKPMIITLLPFLILFGWLLINVGNQPIIPDQEFTTSVIFKQPINGTVIIQVPSDITLISEATQEIKPGKIGSWIFKSDRGVAEWKLKGKQGNYELKYTYKGITYNKDLLITDKYEYARLQINVKDSDIISIKINNKTLKILGLHWMLVYIILTLIFSSIFR